MPSFSAASRQTLTTCDARLQHLFAAVIGDYDCTVIEGYRSPDRQHALFAQGKTKVRRGKHNESPSLAVDVAPYIDGRGIPWPVPPNWSNHHSRSRYIKD